MYRQRFRPYSINLIFLLVAVLLTSCHKEETINASAFQSELRSVQKLVLARMTVSKMATIDDLKLDEAKGARQIASAVISAIKPGTRRAAYSYDTYLYAYIDLSGLDADDFRAIDSKTIEITLPPIEIAYEGRDIEIREEHYRVTGLRSEINAAERAALKEEMNSVLKQEVENDSSYANSLKDNARKKLETYFTAFAENHGININLRYPDGTIVHLSSPQEAGKDKIVIRD